MCTTGCEKDGPFVRLFNFLWDIHHKQSKHSLHSSFFFFSLKPTKRIIRRTKSRKTNQATTSRHKKKKRKTERQIIAEKTWKSFAIPVRMWCNHAQWVIPQSDTQKYNTSCTCAVVQYRPRQCTDITDSDGKTKPGSISGGKEKELDCRASQTFFLPDTNHDPPPVPGRNIWHYLSKRIC